MASSSNALILMPPCFVQIGIIITMSHTLPLLHLSWACGAAVGARPGARRPEAPPLRRQGPPSLQEVRATLS